MKVSLRLLSSQPLLTATEITMGRVSGWYNHCIGMNKLVRPFAAKANVEYFAIIGPPPITHV